MSKFIDVLKKIASDVKVGALFVAHSLVALFGKDAMQQFAQSSLALLKTAIGQIVAQVVEEMQNTSLDNTAKREQAVVQILQIALKQGITVAESEVRLLIELAVQFVKGKIAPTGTDPSLISG